MQCVGSVKVLTCCFNIINIEGHCLASDFNEALHEMFLKCVGVNGELFKGDVVVNPLLFKEIYEEMESVVQT